MTAPDPAGPPVLLVEDDPGLRNAYGLALKASGLPVETAGSVADALERLGRTRERPLAVVVADLGLPDASGVEVVRRVREISPDVTLLVLTGEDSERLRLGCESAGADDFLVKPVSGRELADRLRGAARADRGD